MAGEGPMPAFHEGPRAPMRPHRRPSAPQRRPTCTRAKPSWQPPPSMGPPRHDRCCSAVSPVPGPAGRLASSNSTEPQASPHLPPRISSRPGTSRAPGYRVATESNALVCAPARGTTYAAAVFIGCPTTAGLATVGSVAGRSAVSRSVFADPAGTTPLLANPAAPNSSARARVTSAWSVGVVAARCHLASVPVSDLAASTTARDSFPDPAVADAGSNTPVGEQLCVTHPASSVYPCGPRVHLPLR